MSHLPSPLWSFALVATVAGCAVDIDEPAFPDNENAQDAAFSNTSPLTANEAPLHLLTADALSLDGVPDGSLLSHCDEPVAPSMAVEVACYFFERGEFGSFAGRRGAAVEYVKFPAVGKERAAIVIVTGRTESHIKYAPLVYELTALNPARGYTVYVLEHRGQGFSGGRLGDDPVTDADNWQKGHVRKFSWYVDDMRTFMTDVVAPQSHQRTFMLAHSMGGAVATRYLERFNADSKVDAVVLSSPMNQIILTPEQELLVNVARSALFLIGEDYAVGQGPWTYGSFENVTSSEVRWIYNRRWDVDFPEIRLGGPTYRWTVESYDAAKRGVTNAGDILAPVLLFQSGRDQLVAAEGQNEVCARAQNCRLVRIEDAEHELMQEADSIRTPYLEQVFDFFEQQD